MRSRGAEDRVELGGQVVGVLAAGRVIGGEREDLANRDAQRIAGEIVQALGTPVGPDVHAVADGARPRQIAGLCALWGLPGQSGWLPLSRDYGVARATVRRAVNETTWAHVKSEQAAEPDGEPAND